MTRITARLPRRPAPAAGLMLAVLTLSPLLGAGCGPGAAASDPDEGRSVLVAALDAWKSGEPPEALAGREPSIHVADEDWKAGARLQGYQADEAGRLVGGDVNFRVFLELKTPKGGVVRKDIVYAVTTRPQRLVLRQEQL